MGDIERINKIIQQHLQDCEDYYRESKRSLQVEPEADVRERFEDLKALDDFGRFIYNRVRNFGRGRKLNSVEELFNTGRSIFDRFKDQEEPGALRDAPDYRRIEERIIYSGLSHRKRG